MQPRSKKDDVATKRLCTRSTFRSSLMGSIGESQVVYKTPLRYLLVTQSRLLTAVIVTWCCCIFIIGSSATR